MMMMQMYFYQSCHAIFLFQQLESKKDECGKYAGYLFLTFLFCILVDALPILKSKLLKSSFGSTQSKALVLAIQYLWYVGSAMAMLLLMTFNWGVVLVVCCTKAGMYLLWGVDREAANINSSVKGGSAALIDG